MAYLLAAEADKIQEFVFRSSRLREVVGASEMLNRFCDEGVEPLLTGHGGDPNHDLPVNDGGSIRAIFNGADAEKRARKFGADLAELYRLSLGGSLSVAKPVVLNGNFRDANKRASEALRHSKQHRKGTTLDAHGAYIAYCASCGVGLARMHGRLQGEEAGEDRSRYLCAICLAKADERWQERSARLQEFRSAVVGTKGETPEDFHFHWPQDADAVARYDLRGRSYVAYLVADGNSMGQLFGQCDKEQIEKLSQEMPEVVLKSLSYAAGLAFARLDSKVDKKGRRIIPVLPLIRGGDDLFALISAPYALDLARRFCLTFEKKMAGVVQELELPFKPRMSAAVVICKRKYPYRLAHERATQLLKEAKRQSKLLAAEHGGHLSAVNFEVILGNRLAGQDDEGGDAAIRSSLRPYWVVAKDVILSDEAKAHGIDLQQLLDQRRKLKNVPHRRLAMLRHRFAQIPDDIRVQNRHQKLAAWERTMETILARSGKQEKPLRQALAALGQSPADNQRDTHHWRELRHKDDDLLAHGLLDLLEAWDFAQDLNHPPEEYEPEEIIVGEGENE